MFLHTFPYLVHYCLFSELCLHVVYSIRACILSVLKLFPFLPFSLHPLSLSLLSLQFDSSKKSETCSSEQGKLKESVMPLIVGYSNFILSLSYFLDLLLPFYLLFLVVVNRKAHLSVVLAQLTESKAKRAITIKIATSACKHEILTRTFSHVPKASVHLAAID